MSKYGYEITTSGYPQLWLEDGYCAIGATGAVGALTNFNQISTIVRNSTGNYTLTGVALWNILGVHPTLHTANAAVAVYPQVAVIGTATVSGATVSTVTLQFVNGSGAATDPPSGGGFTCLIMFSKSALVGNA